MFHTMQIKILIIVSLSISGCLSQQLKKETYTTKIKYFLEMDNNHLKGELNQKFYLKGDFTPVFIGTSEKRAISYCYKVYYKKDQSVKIELLKTNGYSYDNGKIIKGKNFSVKNVGIVKKNDEKGREIYSYNFTTSEVTETFYGVQYTEVHTFIKDDLKKIEIKKEFPNYILDRKIKNYFENNILKKSIEYKNNQIMNYYIYNNFSKEDTYINLGEGSKNIIIYNANGINTKPNLYYTLKLKRLRREYLKEKSKETYDSIVKLKKILHVPDLNLTLEQQFFNKIDKLNERNR